MRASIYSKNDNRFLYWGIKRTPKFQELSREGHVVVDEEFGGYPNWRKYDPTTGKTIPDDERRERLQRGEDNRKTEREKVWDILETIRTSPNPDTGKAINALIDAVKLIWNK